MFDHNIAIVTVNSGGGLLNKSIQTWPNDFQVYSIDGGDGLYGLEAIHLAIQKLQKFEFLIFLDEDVFMENSKLIRALIEKMVDEKIDVYGVRDAFIGDIRQFNPEVLNTFLFIMKLKNVLPIYCINEIKKNQYLVPHEFGNKISVQPGNYNYEILAEPYYCFFLWLKRKGMNFKYLKTSQNYFENDSITTTIYVDDLIFCHHTWYAREYNKCNIQKNRINKVISSLSLIGKPRNIRNLRSRNYIKSIKFILKKNLIKLSNIF